jgi:hypothetical protein
VVGWSLVLLVLEFIAGLQYNSVPAAIGVTAAWGPKRAKEIGWQCVKWLLVGWRQRVCCRVEGNSQSSEDTAYVSTTVATGKHNNPYGLSKRNEIAAKTTTTQGTEHHPIYATSNNGTPYARDEQQTPWIPANEGIMAMNLPISTRRNLQQKGKELDGERAPRLKSQAVKEEQTRILK